MVSLSARLARHGQVSTALTLLSDRRLATMLASATPLGSGIGGTTWRIDVDGTPVFVKRVVLTDVELRPENHRGTADLFGLPTWYHYGAGSAGCGAWRELAAHVMTSDWTLTGQCENFPLLHHWRVLPGAPRPVDRMALERSVEFWHDDAGIRRRLAALAESSVDLVLFLEYVPRDLSEWLRAGQPAEAACALLERDLLGIAEFLGPHGFQHFDAHFRNVLTDGERLYLTDFGLACCAGFEFAPDEARFLADHALYDRGYVVADLVNWVVTAFSDAGRRGWEPRVRNEFVRRCADGMAVPELPKRAAAIVRHHAPTAVVVNEFHLALFGESRKTPYPKDELERAIHRPAR